MIFKGINRCITPIAECRVEENDIPLFAKYLFLFPENIKNDILIHKDYYQLENKIQTYKNSVGLTKPMLDDKDIRKTWVSSKFLSRPGDRRNPLYETNFIWDFCDFLESYTVWDVRSLVHLYKVICHFLRQYVNYSSHQEEPEPVNAICHFLIFDVFKPCMETTRLIYKYAQSTEEFEITNSFFRCIDHLMDLCMHQTYIDSEVETFAYVLCTFYRACGIYVKDLGLDDSNSFDPFLMYYLYLTSGNQVGKINAALEISKFINNFNSGNIKEFKISERVFTESESDVRLHYDDISGISDTNVTIFGNTPYVSTLTEDIDTLKKNLLKVNSDMVRSYLNKGEEVKVNFVIDEQLKMYLQSELECKMLVANVRRSDESAMLTVLQYENDNFVLFTISDDHDTLYGLTIEEDPSTKERKLISIDKDEDLTFRFVINLEEE